MTRPQVNIDRLPEFSKHGDDAESRHAMLVAEATSIIVAGGVIPEEMRLELEAVTGNEGLAIAVANKNAAKGRAKKNSR